MPEGGVARMERVLEMEGHARTSSLDLVKRELITRLGKEALR